MQELNAIEKNATLNGEFQSETIILAHSTASSAIIIMSKARLASNKNKSLTHCLDLARIEHIG